MLMNFFILQTFTQASNTTDLNFFENVFIFLLLLLLFDSIRISLKYFPDICTVVIKSIKNFVSAVPNQIVNTLHGMQ